MTDYNNKIFLPSRGKYGKTYVMVRTPTVGDVWSFASYKGDDVEAKNNYLKKLVEPGFDLAAYPVGDREFIFISIRGLTSNYVISNVLECTEEGCEGKVPYTLDIRKVHTKSLPKDFQKVVKFKLPASGEEIGLTLLTVGRERLLNEFMGMYASEDGDRPHMDIYRAAGLDLEELARHAILIDGVEDFDSLEGAVTRVREMDFADFEIIVLYRLAFDCSPDMHAEAQCVECNKEYRVFVETTSTFFGISLAQLLKKHRFLAKNSSISLSDFKDYTVQEMNAVADETVAQVQKNNKNRK